MKKKLNKSGISLIVLVITIIIMIILAAAIILSLNSSGIIERANKAKADSDIANKKQAATVALAEYELLVNSNDPSVSGKTATQYVQEKLQAQGIDGSDIAITDSREILVGLTGAAVSAISKGVKLGEYVAYTPTAKTSSTYKVGTTNTYFATQTGTGALKWRYMGIDENGNALLVADTSTKDSLRLYGKEGYLQGPAKLNALCKELYSGTLGDARSINVDDVNKVLGASPVGQYTSKTGNIINNTEDLTVSELISQKGETALTATMAAETGKSINDYVSNSYTYVGTTYKANTTEEYKLVFKNSSNASISYGIASPYFHVFFNNGGYAYFGIFFVSEGSVCSTNKYNFVSYGAEIGYDHSVRPVIVLKSGVEFGTKTAGVWSIS